MAKKNRVPAAPSIILTGQAITVRIRQIRNGEENFAPERIQGLKNDIERSDLSEKDRDLHLLAVGVLEHSILGRRPRTLIQKAKASSDPKDRKFFAKQAASCFQAYLAFCQNNPRVISVTAQDHQEFVESGREAVSFADSLPEPASESTPSPTVKQDPAAAE